MKLHQVIQTQRGPARVIGFPMLHGFVRGVRAKVVEGGEEILMTISAAKRLQEGSGNEQN